MRALILGAGEAGRFLAASLSSEAEVVIVDNDPATLAEAEDGLDVLVVHGDVTHRRVLERAEAHRADLAVAVTGSDAVNVAAAVMAREVGVGRTVARVDDPGFYRGHEGVERDVAGIAACICASRLVGSELLRLVSSVDVSFSASLGGGMAHVALVRLDDTSPLRGENPSRLRSRSQGTDRAATGAAVQAVLRGGTLRGNHEVEALDEGDSILVVGSPLAAAALVQRSRSSGRDRVVLVGGGDVGLQLANLFSTLVSDVRLVESGRGRCENLAQLAPNVSVLHGDGTNLSFLREERMGTADCMLAVTGSDEINLMSSLLAHELGVEHTFALVHRPGYTAVYEHLGLSGTTSAHEVMAHTLQGLLPNRELVSASPLAGTDLELFELRVPPLRRPLASRSVPLGPGAHVVAVIDHHETNCLLDANALVKGGEHLIVVAPGHRRREILRALRHMGGAEGAA